jgi:hypothetical protein
MIGSKGPAEVEERVSADFLHSPGDEQYDDSQYDPVPRKGGNAVRANEADEAAHGEEDSHERHDCGDRKRHGIFRDEQVTTLPELVEDRGLGVNLVDGNVNVLDIFA